jgi:hypothetical protein
MVAIPILLAAQQLAYAETEADIGRFAGQLMGKRAAQRGEERPITSKCGGLSYSEYCVGFMHGFYEGYDAVIAKQMKK